jgi:hypothetical protein
MALDTPISVAVKSVHCIHDTVELGNDEVYVVVLAADLRQQLGVTVPRLSLTFTGVWSGTNDFEGRAVKLLPIPEGETENFWDGIPLVWKKHCWGLGGTAAPIAHPDDVLLLVALMENDDASLRNVKSVATGILTGDLASVANSGLSRPVFVQKMKEFMDGALPAAGMAFPSGDVLIGHSHELELTDADLHAARSHVIKKELHFGKPSGSDGRGTYHVFIQLGPAGSI